MYGRRDSQIKLGKCAHNLFNCSSLTDDIKTSDVNKSTGSSMCQQISSTFDLLPRDTCTCAWNSNPWQVFRLWQQNYNQIPFLFFLQREVIRVRAKIWKFYYKRLNTHKQYFFLLLIFFQTGFSLQGYLFNGLMQIERFSESGNFSWREILRNLIQIVLQNVV